MKLILILLFFFSNLACAQLYIFVSHSMPDKALQAYFAEAQKHNATLIMRGLINDSFVASQEKCQQLNIAYDINPELFEKYSVSEVPTIILDINDDIKKLSGHIHLIDALNIFSK